MLTQPEGEENVFQKAYDYSSDEDMVEEEEETQPRESPVIKRSWQDKREEIRRVGEANRRVSLLFQGSLHTCLG